MPEHPRDRAQAEHDPVVVVAAEEVGLVLIVLLVQLQGGRTCRSAVVDGRVVDHAEGVALVPAEHLAVPEHESSSRRSALANSPRERRSAP